jgi:hypothetical protein
MARELAEEQSRKEREDEWRAWQVFKVDDEDEALERARARGYETRQQRADMERGDR